MEKNRTIRRELDGSLTLIEDERTKKIPAGKSPEEEAAMIKAFFTSD